METSRSLRSLPVVGLHDAVIAVRGPAQIEAGRAGIGRKNLMLAVLARSYLGPLLLRLSADHPINLKIQAADSRVLRTCAIRRVRKCKLGSRKLCLYGPTATQAIDGFLSLLRRAHPLEVEPTTRAVVFVDRQDRPPPTLCGI